MLRPFRANDSQAVTQALNNIYVARNLARVKFPYAAEVARQWFVFQKGFDQSSMICAIAFRTAPDELFGAISYEVREVADTIFGYWLRECCWRMGLTTEAAGALVHYAFTEGNMTMLASAYHKDNPNSGRILQKIGFWESRSSVGKALRRQALAWLKIPKFQASNLAPPATSGPTNKKTAQHDRAA